MTSEMKQRVSTAVAAVIVVVVLCFLSWISTRPEAEPVPTVMETHASADTAVPVKTERAKKTKKEKTPRRKPAQRDFLNEPVESR